MEPSALITYLSMVNSNTAPSKITINDLDEKNRKERKNKEKREH